MNSEVKKFIRGLARTRPGWYYKGYTGGGHLRINYVPGGHVIIAATPSDRCWMANAYRDMDAVEAASGPYTPSYAKRKKDPGLSYKELLAQQQEAAREVEQQKKPPIIEVPLPAFLQPKLEEPAAHKSATVIVPTKPKTTEYVPRATQPKTKEESFMSMFDREIIIRIMQEKYDSLRIKLEPFLEEIEEFQRVEKTLNELKRAAKPEAEKVAEFLAAKKVAAPKVEEVLEGTVTKVSARTVYAATEEIIQSHGGKMDIPEIIAWLKEVKNYDFSKPGLSDRTSFTQHIGQINVGRTQDSKTLYFGPEHLEGETRSPYKWIEYRQKDSTPAIRHYSNSNQ